MSPKTAVSSRLLLLIASFLCACAGAKAGPQVEINGHRFDVEIAADPASQARGLMFREHLAPGNGMLFVFPDTAPRAFWMKNTKIPLDMLFFDSARKLVSVQRQASPCRMDPCQLYPSEGPARYVLELNGGASDALDLKPGDEMQIKR